MSQKLRCWPGALAYIVRAVHAENVGAIVTVVRWVAAGDHIPEEPEAGTPDSGWLVRSTHPLMGTQDWEREPLLSIFADDALRPILPPPSDKATPTETTAPAGVTAEV